MSETLSHLLASIRLMMQGAEIDHALLAAEKNRCAFLLVNAAMFVLLGLMWVVYRTALPILIERMSA